jgi:hypothetical protein
MSTRFADRINEEIYGDCPYCGWGMPGPHEEKCPVRLIALKVERAVRSREGRATVLLLLRSLRPKGSPETRMEIGSKWTHPFDVSDALFRPMTVRKVIDKETLLMSDGHEWTLSDLESAGWQCP